MQKEKRNKLMFVVLYEVYKMFTKTVESDLSVELKLIWKRIWKFLKIQLKTSRIKNSAYSFLLILQCKKNYVCYFVISESI